MNKIPRSHGMPIHSVFDQPSRMFTARIILFLFLFGVFRSSNGFSYIYEPNTEVIIDDDFDFTSKTPVIRAKRFADNFNYTSNYMAMTRKRRSDDGAFIGHPKTREERWHVAFDLNRASLQMDQTQALVSLLIKVMDKYLNACTPIILYDQYVESSEGVILQTFFQNIKITYLHGKISQNYTVVNSHLMKPFDKSCRSYFLFLSDVLRTRDVLGPQTTDKVVLIPRSTQWKLQEFLASKEASDIVNLLVVGESLSADPTKERPYVLYTHKLYTDGLGSNMPTVLTSWIRGKLSRPNVNLFPRKFHHGFSAHRFTVAAIDQPPFMMKTVTTDIAGNIKIDWDGYEWRLLKLIGEHMNFSYQILEPLEENDLGRTYAVIDMVEQRQADIGAAGSFISIERMLRIDMSHRHSDDCAAFITLSSKALPRYRAILGPFQWPVWLAIIAAYLFAIFPLSFSDRLTLSHLIGNWSEIENMFWYVYGTFTNSLTFSNEFSWSNTKKTSTRILIGCYWVFSIIITACYTGSIIAFVTLPVFPDTIDSIQDLLDGFYRVGTLSKDGWQYWFTNSTDPDTRKLLKSLELVEDVDEGLRNVTQAFFWGYAFLGSRSQLEFLVQNNMTGEELGKKSALHIAHECLSSFGVSMMFPHNSVYADSVNSIILQMSASGLNLKIKNDMAWDLQRSDTDALLQSTKNKKFSFADVEERKLNLADTEGMFLLMAVGYTIAGSVLVSEIVGGCARKLRAFVRRQSDTIVTGTRNVVRRSSLAESANEEDYVPKNFADKVRHKVVRKLLKPKPKPQPKLQPKPEVNPPHDEKRTFSFGAVRRIVMWRKSKQDVPSNEGTQIEETHKNAVEMNFESSVEHNPKCQVEGSSKFASGMTNDSSTIIEVATNSSDNSLVATDGNSTGLHQNV